MQYGLVTYADLFTPRQLVALTTFSDFVQQARERVQHDAVVAGLADSDKPLQDGGTGAKAYAEAVGVYLSLGVSKLSDAQSSLCRWKTTMDQSIATFGRQALPMVWDYSEANVFAGMAGDPLVSINNMMRVVDQLPASVNGHTDQAAAQRQIWRSASVVSTDPPYYDNIGYADLSDFFYVWLRRSLKSILPDLFATLAVPKSDELVASPYRHGSKGEAETFFLNGMGQAMRRIAEHAHPGFPVSIYYAFKQAETKGGSGTVSTGWETFLDAVIRAGFAVTGTWPMRTELSNRMIGMDTNALASSIVLVCRRRSVNAPAATRREYLAALKSELPMALRLLQTGNVAPVDLAQAAIGPGMAVYTRYATVLLKWGPSLEHAAKRTGGVTGIVGSRYFTISAERQQNHAGTTPMALRRDAGRALVEITPGSTTCFRSMPASGGCGPSEITKRLPLPTRLGVWRIEAQSRYYNRAIHRGAAAERSPPRGGGGACAAGSLRVTRGPRSRRYATLGSWA